MRRSLTVLLMLVFATGLAACGDSDEDKVRDTLDRFRGAIADGDPREICGDLLTTELVDSIRSAGVTCEVAVGTGIDGVNKPTLEIGRVRLQGDRAYAEVITGARGQKGSKDVVELRKEGDEWRLMTLAGSGPQPPSRPRLPADEE